LRTVTFSTTSTVAGSRSIQFSLGPGLPYSVNGHYYEYINVGGLTWPAASAAASARTYFGRQGYLATITSAGENAFVEQKLNGNGWIGGSDNAVEGTWQWVTGPAGEINQTFCTVNAGVCVAAPGWYENFATGLIGGNPYDEPNNGYGTGENYAHFWALCRVIGTIWTGTTLRLKDMWLNMAA
jgi:hypothetical protein